MSDHVYIEHAAVTGYARVSGRASLMGAKVAVTDFAQVYDRARLRDGANVRGHARVFGEAVLRDTAKVENHGVVCDEAGMIGSSYVTDQAVLYGRGLLVGCTLSGNARCARRIDKGFSLPLVLDDKPEWESKCTLEGADLRLMLFLHNVSYRYVYSVSYTGEHVLYCLKPQYVDTLLKKLRMPSSRVVRWYGGVNFHYLAISLRDLLSIV